MLPVPARDFTPKIFKSTPDLLALQAKLDKFNLGWKKDVLTFLQFFDPVKAPSVILDELGYYFNAGIKASDNEDTKRKKIARAVATHKKLGEWANDIKIRIDDITGLNTLLFNDIGGDHFIICDGGTTPPFAAYYWSAIGNDEIDTNLGPTIDGGESAGNAWNVFIDFTANISAPQLAAVIAIFEEDFIPAYLVIHLGYVTGIVFNELAVI